MTLQDSIPSARELTEPTEEHACSGLCGGPTRRSVLRGAGAVSLGAAVTLLAACSSSGSGTTPASTGAAPSAPAAGASGGASSGGAASSALAQLADIPVGGAISVNGADGKPIILAQPVAGTVVGMSAICTHQGCTVAPDGADLVCPCHGSVFTSADGSVVNGPASKALPAVTVHVDGGAVVAG